jgi:hypothetical protein
MLSLLAEGGVATPPPAQNNFGDTLSDGVAGPTALLIIVLLAIATVLLIRNMNKRLRRLPAQFPVTAGANPAGSSAAPAGRSSQPGRQAQAGQVAQAGRSADPGPAAGGVADPTSPSSDEPRS